MNLEAVLVCASAALMIAGCATPSMRAAAVEERHGEIKKGIDTVGEVAASVDAARRGIQTETERIATSVEAAKESAAARNIKRAAAEIDRIGAASQRASLHAWALERDVELLREASENMSRSLKAARRNTERLARQAKRARAWRTVAIVLITAFAAAITVIVCMRLKG